MAASSVFVDEFGEVKVYKRRGQKNIRLRVDSSGAVKLSLPWYVSKRVGIIYIKSKKDWLNEQLKTHAKHSSQISSVGDYKVEINFIARSPSTISVEGKNIKISLKDRRTDQKNLTEISRLLEVYFRKTAETTISEKLQKIADHNKIKISDTKVKKMKGRWGSCDNKKNITLNLYLAQMPEEIWSYVLCHELAHTKYMDHGKDFWRTVEQLDKNYKINKKILKSFSPGKLDMR